MGALTAVLGDLACPQCGAGLARDGEAVRCGAGHAFDVAKQGYVSLLTGHARATEGDDAAMVAARERVLGAGHLDWLADALTTEAGVLLEAGPEGCVVDVGAGTGWYLASVLDRLESRRGVALDVSRYALRRAARAHPRAVAVACDVWQRLPLADAAAALVLDVFAPRNGPELARVLHPDGALLVVTPTPRHLAGLPSALLPVRVDERKRDRLDETLGSHLDRVAERVLEQPLVLAREGVRDIVAMGPSARHRTGESIAEVVGVLPEPVAVTASVTLSVHRHRGASGEPRTRRRPVSQP